jgi:hypothetical protein
LYIKFSYQNVSLYAYIRCFCCFFFFFIPFPNAIWKIYWKFHILFWVYIHLKRKTIFVQFLGDGMYMYIQNVYVMKKDRAFLMSLFHWCMELNFCCTVFARKNKLWIFMIPRAFFLFFLSLFQKLYNTETPYFSWRKKWKKEKKIESTCASIKSFNV